MSLTASGPAGRILAAEGAGFNRADRLFVDRPSDFLVARQVFNTVLVSPGDSTWVRDAAGAGMKTILEFDYKWDFIDGLDIAPRVQDVIDQIVASPGTVAGVYVGDRLNSWAEPSGTHAAIPPDRMIEYLRLTGGVIHQQFPGLPVYVDVEDGELTCGEPGQATCDFMQPGSTSMYRYENNSVLTSLVNSGYIDGFILADNLNNNCASVTSPSCWDPNVQARAFHVARCLWPSPFKLMSRTSRLSFWESTYPGSDSLAQRQTQAAMGIPIQAGADGALLWGWHIPWTDNGLPSVRTWLNKDGTGNVLWSRMQQASAPYLGGAGDTIPPTGTVSHPAAGEHLVSGQSTFIVSDLKDPSGIATTTAFLSLDGGRSYPYRFYCGAYVDSIPWNVPPLISDSCRVRLVVADVSGNPTTVTTNAVFSMNGRPVGVGDGERGTDLALSARPDPASERSTIVFTLPRRGAVRLDVVDVTGRRRRVLAASSYEAGRHALEWDLSDERGGALGPGVYFLRMQAAGRVVTRHVVVLR